MSMRYFTRGFLLAASISAAAMVFIMGCGSGTLSLYNEDGTLDTTKVLSSTDPADEATNIPIDVTIYLVFDRAVASTSASSNTVVLAVNEVTSESIADKDMMDAEQADGSVETTLSLNSTEEQIIVDPVVSLGYYTRYCITISGVQTQDGDTFADYTFCFRTVSSEDSGETSDGSDEEADGEATITGADVLAENLSSPGNLVCDTASCCWVENMQSSTTGKVSCYDLSAGTVASLTSLNQPQKVHIKNDTRVCYILSPSAESKRRVYCCDRDDPLDAATCGIFAEDDNYAFVNGRMSNGSHFYFGDGTNTVRKVSTTNAAISDICMAQNPVETTFDTSRAYFVYAQSDGDNFFNLGTCRLNGADANAVLLATLEYENLFGFVSDDSYLYFLDGNTSGSTATNFKLKRVPVDASGSAETLYSNIPTNGLAVDEEGNYVYVPTSDGIISVGKSTGNAATVVENVGVKSIAVSGSYVYGVTNENAASRLIRAPLTE